MKQMRNLIQGLVLSGIALAMVSTVLAQAPVDKTIKVVRKTGPVRYTMGNGVWQPLEVGDVLKPGAVIQTGKEAGCFVDLVLGGTGTEEISRSTVFKPFLPSANMVYHGAAVSQNVVRLWQNTALGIDKLTSLQTGAGEVTETQLDLKAGRISGTAKKLTPGSRYEIKLPNGVAGIRGTIFDITAEGNVRVLAGTVVLSLIGPDGNPKTVVINASEAFNPVDGTVGAMAPNVQNTIAAEVGTVSVVGASSGSTVSSDRTIYNTMSPTGPSTAPSSTTTVR